MDCVARNLKLMREANALTQEQTAGYLNVKRSAYSNYETGERIAPEEILAKSAELLGCDPALFHEESEDVVKSTFLVCAYRIDALSDKDMKELARFKKVALNYLKISKLSEE